MIEPLVQAIRDHVITPQSAPDIPTSRRLYLDPDNVPMNVQLQTAEVAPIDSTPIAAEIGGGSVTMRHRVTLVVACESSSREDALHVRNRIVTDLARRSLTLDWTNTANLGADQDVIKTALLIEYPDLDPESLAAWATLTYTIDTEWSVA